MPIIPSSIATILIQCKKKLSKEIYRSTTEWPAKSCKTKGKNKKSISNLYLIYIYIYIYMTSSSSSNTRPRKKKQSILIQENQERIQPQLAPSTSSSSLVLGSWISRWPIAVKGTSEKFIASQLGIKAGQLKKCKITSVLLWVDGGPYFFILAWHR
jgi:hypothetical protein